jgi:hypothetical protein
MPIGSHPEDVFRRRTEAELVLGAGLGNSSRSHLPKGCVATSSRWRTFSSDMRVELRLIVLSKRAYEKGEPQQGLRSVASSKSWKSSEGGLRCKLATATKAQPGIGFRQPSRGQSILSPPTRSCRRSPIHLRPNLYPTADSDAFDRRPLTALQAGRPARRSARNKLRARDLQP